jgi:hypothetical protein
MKTHFRGIAASTSGRDVPENIGRQALKEDQFKQSPPSVRCSKSI